MPSPFSRLSPALEPDTQLAEPSFDTKRHVTYWLRCLKTFLPNVYTANDSNRMTFAFFVVSALDLLDCLVPHTTAAEREGYAQWIYHCQHPAGGFRAFPGTDFGERRSAQNECWDPANLPATYFALATLLVLGDDLERVKRRECLAWLAKLQRPDGGFGETLVNGRIEGGSDTRFGYCATGVRWILRGTVEGPVEGVEDVNVDQFVQCVRLSETYDGGISDAPFHEAHAGFTYCAISALSFVDRLPHGAKTYDQNAREDDRPLAGLSDLHATIRWLASRQTATLDEDDEVDTNGDETDTPSTCHDAHTFVRLRGFPSEQGEQSYKERPTSHLDLQWAGFNGRCNKLADMCYAFWVGASLDVLHKAPIASRPRSRRYLLDRTQHPAGGFAKHPGDPPDIYHSYLGLAALALMREPALKPLDAVMCVSVAARRCVDGLRWRRSIVGEGGRGRGEEGEEGKGEGVTKGTERTEGTEARGGESRPAAPSSAGTTASASDGFA
ncbi:hypothetical protein B0A49_06955, partial [Cryomyces minteri]